MLAHFTGLPVYNFGITGALSSEIVSAEGGLVKRESPYGNVSRLMAVAEEGRQHRGDILIAEMGSNGGWSSYDELVSQYREMLKYSHCDKYLILGDTDDPGKSSADIDQEPLTNPTDETSWETALREAFGEHFVNLRLYLVNNGLSVSGLQPTTEDLEAMALGNIPPQLRSDYTHFNGYGYYAMARAVYEHGAELGYW